MTLEKKRIRTVRKRRSLAGRKRCQVNRPVKRPGIRELRALPDPDPDPGPTGSGSGSKNLVFFGSGSGSGSIYKFNLRPGSQYISNSLAYRTFQ